MPWGLQRFHESAQTHFVTFTCFHRRILLTETAAIRTVECALERVRHSFGLHIYGYVVMPEHVHLLVSEPKRDTLAVAIKSLKQGVSRRLIGKAPHFWQKRYYDFNIRDHSQFVEKLRYIHRNPVKDGSQSNPIGPQQNANEQQDCSAPRSNYPTQANSGLEWATHPTTRKDHRAGQMPRRRRRVNNSPT